MILMIKVIRWRRQALSSAALSIFHGDNDYDDDDDDYDEDYY